eukprot:643943-Rhodomonas_salina.1
MQKRFGDETILAQDKLGCQCLNHPLPLAGALSKVYSSCGVDGYPKQLHFLVLNLADTNSRIEAVKNSIRFRLDKRGGQRGYKLLHTTDTTPHPRSQTLEQYRNSDEFLVEAPALSMSCYAFYVGKLLLNPRSVSYINSLRLYNADLGCRLSWLARWAVGWREPMEVTMQQLSESTPLQHPQIPESKRSKCGYPRSIYDRWRWRMES